MYSSARKIPEVRRSPRRKVLVSASVSASKTSMMHFPCILKDISETGCQIVGSNTEYVAKVFYLRSSAFEGERKCKVVWRARRIIGAAFVEG
jgi:hypothetical protein